jgi:hypothetical protein
MLTTDKTGLAALASTYLRRHVLAQSERGRRYRA